MFHIEAAKGDPLTLIRRIHETGMKAGLAVKPKTMVESVLPFAAAVDMILIMTVEPGFGGQKFMPHCLEKACHSLLFFPYSRFTLILIPSDSLTCRLPF